MRDPGARQARGQRNPRLRHLLTCNESQALPNDLRNVICHWSVRLGIEHRRKLTQCYQMHSPNPCDNKAPAITLPTC